MADPGDLPADLGVAIFERIRATPDLIDALSGGAYRDKARRDPAGPQVVFRIASGRPSHQSSASRYMELRARFVVYADDSNLAATLGSRVAGAFEARPLEYEAGWTTPWEVVGVSEDEILKPVSQDMSFKSVVDFRFHESRTGG